MATVFTQDAVLHFLQSSGGKVKNSELLQHFRNFIRNHADQDRNRELFKKFVNSVAIVKQEDGVNYVVLRKKYKGNVPGVGGGASWLPAGRNTETSPGGTTVNPAVNADKPRVKHTQRREEAAPSLQGETTGTAVLPVAGIIHNNNNNTEMKFNQKQKQQQLNSTPGLSGRPSDLTQISEKIPNLCQPPDPVQCTKVSEQKADVQFSAAASVVSAVRHHGGSNQQDMVQTPRGTEAGPQPGGGVVPHQGSVLHHVNVEPQMAPRRFKYRPSYKTAVSHDDEEEEEEEEEEVTVRRGSAGGVWPLSAPLENMRVISTSSPCIIDQPTPPSFVTSSSSSSSERNLPKIFVQGVKMEELSTYDQGESFRPGVGFKGQWTGSRPEDRFVSPESISTRNNRPIKAEHYTPSPDRTKEASPRSDVFQDLQYSQASGVQMDPRQGSHQRTLMSSSLSSSISPVSDASLSSSNWPPSGSSRGSGWSSSHEDLHTRTFSTGEAEHAPNIQEVLQRVQRTRPQPVIHLADSETTVGYLHGDQTPTARLSPFHHSTEYLHDDRGLWRNSTGDLNDNRDEAESSDGSAATPPLRQRPTVARRFSSQLRNRMCRSLGADLDQLLHEEARVGEGVGGGSEAARLNRLHLISSSLSLRYNLSSSSLSSCSTPPRCHSLADLAEGEDRKRGRRSLPADIVPSTASTAEPEGSSKQSLVPLEPREHTWLVKAAAGAWPDIYSLFREDSSLLNKQDFISGFTVLHWIAKHGDHRVLNTLWYGVEKAGLMFDVNARSSCGHTPLHLAAMHGHKNIMRLLVKKFDANVKLRDLAGKKPWQYLSRGAPLEFFQLLGAPARAFTGGEGGVNSWEQQQQQQKHRHRRRHHFSTASSGERPLTIAGMTKVKRSSSIAAFLKHKSLHRFHGHQSDSSV